MSAISELSTIHRVKAKTPEEKRLAAKEAGRDNKAGYLFLLPWLIGLVVIVAGPMFASLYLSFTNYSLIQAPELIGLDNYVRMFDDPRLHKSLSVTFIYVIVGVPAQLIVALAIAMLLNEGMKGLAFYRSIFYLPSMLGASVAIAVLWRQMFEVRRPGQPSPQAVRYSKPPLAGSPIRNGRCGPSSCCTCGRSAHQW